jgi:hypothetical protein
MSWLVELGTHWWLPRLSPEVQACLRVAYSVLMLGTLALALPHGRRFFLSERWGGYGKSSVGVDLVQNPTVFPVVMVTWLGSVLLLAAGAWTPWTALVSVLISRYYFVQMRWSGVLRGMGAPGFMIYWLGVAIFLLEFTRAHAPALQPLAVLALQLDLGATLLTAGIYKLSAGYAQNHGMELGLANPEWGYWWRWYTRMRPDHALFHTLNHLAWSTEIAIGVLAFIPATRPIAGLLIVISFACIATQIRLGLLCQTLIAAALVFVPASAEVSTALQSALPWFVLSPSSGPPVSGDVVPWLAAALLGYVALLPLAYGGLLYNVLARRALPAMLRWPLQFYTNACGMILWRVFTADVTNFYVQVHEQPRYGSQRLLVSAYPGLTGCPLQPSPGSLRRRFSHVAESLAITSVFTTLKDSASNSALFEEQLLRYARTIPYLPGSKLVFTYTLLVKTADCFEHIATREFVVDPVASAVECHRLRVDASATATAAASIFEGARPGSYLPLAS